MYRILMCGSSLSVKGGMVSVVRNYLDSKEWGRDFKILYVPTHIERNKYLLILYFGFSYLRILFLATTAKIDIAHLHMSERGSFLRKAFLVKSLKKLGVKTIIHHHASEFEIFYDGLSDAKKQAVNRVLELADLNIVLSGRLIPMVTSRAPRARVEVLYNAVNTYAANPYHPNARNVLFLGRLGQRKGTFDLLESIKRLDAEIDPDIRFYLCGDGAVSEVEQRIEALGIRPRIAHVGWVDGKMKKEFMSRTMIHVLPSYNEGFPMAVLEAMAYGIPTISTNIASIPEVLHDGENGFLITPGDVDALTARLYQLITDKALRETFSDRSYTLLTEAFSLDASLEKLKKIYRTL